MADHAQEEEAAIEELFSDVEPEEKPEDVAGEMMDLIAYQITRRLDELDWTQEKLSDEMGVRPAQVSRLLRSAENTTLLTIARAAEALQLEFASVKLIPEEEMGEQVDEVTPFVCSECEGAKWWPVTRQSSSHVRGRMQELLPDPEEEEESSTPPEFASEAADEVDIPKYA